MSPARHPRSIVHPPWLRVRWWALGLVGFVLLCSGSVFGGATFPLMYVAAAVWLAYRGERDAGCPPSLRKERRHDLREL